MKVMTWQTPNFGDRLNDIVWEHFIPDLLDDNEDALLVGIGSLLNHRLPKDPIKFVLGSGVGHGEMPERDSSWRIVWVRGPVSTSVLDIDPSYAMTDGAILLKEMCTDPMGDEWDCSFIPHETAILAGARDWLRGFCAQCGIHFIDPHQPPLQVIDEIRRSRQLLTEALHGAIVADTFRVPWLPLARRGVYQLKWRDWTQSMSLPYKPVPVAYRPQWFSPGAPQRLSRKLAFPVLRACSPSALRAQFAYLRRYGAWQLSDEKTLTARLVACTDAVHRFAGKMREGGWAE